MRNYVISFCFCAAGLLAGCGSPAQQAATDAKLQGALTVACQTDASVVPITDEILGGLDPKLAPATTIDQALVHPTVLKICGALGGTPIAVPAAPF